MLENNEEKWDAKYQDVSIDGRIYIIINNILEWCSKISKLLASHTNDPFNKCNAFQ